MRVDTKFSLIENNQLSSAGTGLTFGVQSVDNVYRGNVARDIFGGPFTDNGTGNSMRSSIIIVGLIVTFQLAACSGAPQQTDAEQPAALPPDPARATPQQFIEALVQAIQTEDADVLGALFAWDGVDPSQIEGLRLDFSERFFSCKGAPTEIVEARPSPDFVRSGIRYRPNLTIEGRIKIECSPDAIPGLTGFTVPFGSKDGRYLLVNMIQEPTGYTGPPDLSLNVAVHGPATPGRLRFEVGCDYMVSGEPNKLYFEGDGNASEAFWGTHVESCEVRKLEGDGEVRLVIRAGSESIFESAASNLAAPLIYRREKG